jgi:hypothetical protein
MVPRESFPRERLRAPSEHGQALIRPSLTTIETSLAQYHEQLSGQVQQSWLGKPWSEIVATARRDLWTEAIKHSSEYLDTSILKKTDPSRIVLLGHQPELFHAGVWFKNFLAAALSERLSAVTINLLIDNATLNSPAIKVPAGNPADPQIQTVAYDQTTDPVPFEARDVLDHDLFASFAGRVKTATSGWLDDPLIEALWPLVIEGYQATGNLGLALARGRHLLEQQWGIHNLDVPLSAVCNGESFSWFLACILSQLPRFWEIHNTSLAEYREAYRLRSKSHPVPALGKDGDWFEAPFWVWSTTDPQRLPLFVRRQAGQIELTNQQQLTCRLSMPGEEDGQSLVEQLVVQQKQGICIRPRALTTTMYARVVLSDLFVHGIGGGRYDQLTDVIVQRFFGFAPPDFLTATATLQLPIDLPACQQESLGDLDRQLREIKFSPELYLSESTGAPVEANSELAQLISEKQSLLADLQSGQSPTATWHQRLEQINQQLQPFTTKSREQLTKQRETLQAATEQRSLLSSREFSFCLFPQKTLCPLLLALSGKGL